MKFLIFDAGPLISLTMNGLIEVIENLKNVFDGEFIITPQVKREVIDRPLSIKKYKLEAIQVKNLLDKKILRMSGDFVSDAKLNREIKRLMKVSSGFLRTEEDGKKISIIHEGEVSCLAFSNLCASENVIVIDERTTRLLSEAPEKILELMERKLHTKLVMEKSLVKEFEKYKFIRSSEILFIAYKKNLFNMKKDIQLLDALLYGVKFKGAAISSGEIEKMKKLV